MRRLDRVDPAVLHVLEQNPRAEGDGRENRHLRRGVRAADVVRRIGFGEADKAIMRYPADPIDVVLDDAARHVDDARKVQDSYPNVPARFAEADATLREGLRKWREGLDTLRYQHSKDDLMVGEQLIARAQIQMKRAAGMPLGDGGR